MSTPTYHPGRIQWRNLMTSDPDRARSFYHDLFQWTFDTQDMGSGFLYSQIESRGKRIGGLYQTPAGVTAPSHWSSYVSVADVDVACATAAREGGTLMNQPADLASVGRMAAIADPDGAVVWAFRNHRGDPAPAAPIVSEFCWETLVTTDVPRPKAFYKALFGWHAADSGMTVFSIDGTPSTMVADFQSGRAPARWFPYVVVTDLQQSRDHAIALGATILQPGFVVPNVGTYGILRDPTGATLGMLEPIP